MRFRKIFPFLAFTLFATITASQYALAQENETPKASSTDAPLKVGGEVLPPVLTHSVEPKLPRGQSTRTLDAFVLVGLVVDTAGKPSNIHILKSDDSDLDKAAMAAVAKYRFKPATLHGQPVSFDLQVQFRFH
jgi:TonB family protein